MNWCKSAALLSSLLMLACCTAPALGAPTRASVVQLDRSKPVPPKSELVQAWRQRQDRIRTFRFAWTEQQTHPRGWVPVPRLRQPEWMDIPGLNRDRTYVVSKALAVDGNNVRYSYQLDRKQEPDDARVITRLPDLTPEGSQPPANRGLGEGRHYTYVSVFDGQTGKTRLTSLSDAPPPVETRTTANPDAQNLDTRAIMMAFRPLDPVLGHALFDRAVTNQARQFHHGRSTFL